MRLDAITAEDVDGAGLRRSGSGRPSGLTPHSLRRTFASILLAIGETPPYVMAQMGHKRANLTLEVYARQMGRRDGEPERLRALVNGEEFRPSSGRKPDSTHRVEATEVAASTKKTSR